MSFAITLLCLVALGLAVVRLLRLGSGSVVADVALAWLVGSGTFAAAAPLVRFGLGIPLSRTTVLGVVVAAPAALGARWLHGRRRRAGGEPLREAGPAEPPLRARWMPRPVWLFLPILAYVALVAGAALLHGANTPTQTDDGVRVRAFASMMAFADAWPSEARAVFVMAGAIPTFVPALGWTVTGTLDHFHVNYVVLTELLALLALAVAVPSSRAAPERGWASALGVLSVPLFVYHCTSTYSDAVLAMRVAGGVLFAIEYARTREPDDAARALLLLGLATLVKREGQLVAAAPAAVLVAQLAWERRRSVPPIWRAAALFVSPALLEAGGKIAAVGLAAAFPMIGLVSSKAGLSAAAGPAPGTGWAAAAFFLDQALFRSGNAGMIYWVLVAAAAVRARAVLRSRLVWPLAGVAALLGEVAVSSILVVPEYTLDDSTVHRALLVVSVPAALWIAAALADAAGEEGCAAGGEAGAEAAEVTLPRRRSRSVSRR